MKILSLEFVGAGHNPAHPKNLIRRLRHGGKSLTLTSVFLLHRRKSYGKRRHAGGFGT